LASKAISRVKIETLSAFGASSECAGGVATAQIHQRIAGLPPTPNGDAAKIYSRCHAMRNSEPVIRLKLTFKTHNPSRLKVGFCF